MLNAVLMQMYQELGRGIGAVFLKGFNKAPAGELVDCRVLIELLRFCFVKQTGKRDKFHINLNALTGTGHLLIRFRNRFGVMRFYGYQVLFS